MDFYSLQKRDETHAPTHIQKQKRKVTIMITIKKSKITK